VGRLNVVECDLKTVFGKPKVLASICSFFWLAVGTRLLLMGGRAAFHLTSPLQMGTVGGVVLLVAYFKGGHLFSKMARQNLRRLHLHDQPIPFYRLFPKKTYIFIGVFAPTGMLLGKFLVDPFYRAMVLLSVGASLFIGGLFYWIHWKKEFRHDRDYSPESD
jgi:hypothetical protein